MAVVPLVLGQTVVTTEEEFQAADARQGTSLLIRNFDRKQLNGNNPRDPNLSYDLRIGAEYKDHRDGWKRDVLEGEVEILPGGAVIIETEESLHFPDKRFGYIVPRVYWLQRGLSNTLSKVDPGYNGPLLVTLFNLGKTPVSLPRRERFCSLVVHTVSDEAEVHPYDKERKRLEGPPQHLTVWQRTRNWIEANPATAVAISAIPSAIVAIVAIVKSVIGIVRLVLELWHR